MNNEEENKGVVENAADIIEEFESRVSDELFPVDLEESYEGMLDECYSLESVGGLFSNMLASRVLKHLDPVAYRCGMNDYEDSLDLVEINGDYFERRQVQNLKDEMLGEIQDRIEELETQLEEDGERVNAGESLVDDQKREETEKELNQEKEKYEELEKYPVI